MSPLALDLRDLCISFPMSRGRVHVVKSVDLSVEAGSTVGVVGESGSGKTVLLRALMGLLPASAAVESGVLRVHDELIPLVGNGVRSTRRRRLAMIWQDPLAALNPLMSVGEQIAEVPRRVFGESKHASRIIAIDLLNAVKIAAPELFADSLPHEISGGQRQRVMIAMALATRPEVLLCDEPTTALDVTIASQVLELLRDLRERSGLSMVFVSHDMAIITSMADKIVVVRAGSVVESGQSPALVRTPQAAYTRALLEATLQLPREATTTLPCEPAIQASPQGVALAADDVVFGYPGAAAKALNGVSLSLGIGRIYGVVGESGSGKTSLAKILTGQLRPESGHVKLAGRVMGGKRTRQELRAAQMIYQDPFASLDPRMTVGQTFSEILRVALGLPKSKVIPRSLELLQQVSLPASALDGYPAQFSGGQRQRIAIARALAVQPSVLIADEPTSALDATVQTAILQMLLRLRSELNLSIVLISHNIAVVRYLCDDVCVLRGGTVIEAGPVSQVLDNPQHRYTQELIKAVPRLPQDTVRAATNPM